LLQSSADRNQIVAERATELDSVSKRELKYEKIANLSSLLANFMHLYNTRNVFAYRNIE